MSRKTISAAVLAAITAGIIIYGSLRARSVSQPRTRQQIPEKPAPTALDIPLTRAWPLLDLEAGALQVTRTTYTVHTGRAAVFQAHTFPAAPAADWANLLAPASAAFAGLAVCDLDQNGRWEIVTAGALQVTRVFEMHAGPGFRLTQAPFAAGLDSAHDAQVLCADFDGNGQQSLLHWRMPAAGQAGELLRTEFNLHTGTWQRKAMPALPPGIAINDIQLADFNADGITDLFLATGFAPGLTDPYAPWRSVSDLVLLSSDAEITDDTDSAPHWTVLTAEDYWPGTRRAFASSSARIVSTDRGVNTAVQSFNTTGQHATIYGSKRGTRTLPLHVVGGFSWALDEGGTLLLSNMQYLPARDYSTPATHTSALARELAEMGKASVSQTICNRMTSKEAAVLCNNMLQGQTRTFSTGPQNCTHIEAWFYRQKCLASYYSRTGTFSHPLSRQQLQKQYGEMQPHSGPYAELDPETLVRRRPPVWYPADLTRDTPWAMLLADLDLDGNEEVVYSNSYLTRYQSFLRVLQQTDDNARTDIAPKLGIVVPGDTRGLAAADLDGDGDLDLAVNSVFHGLTVLQNQTGGDSIAVDLLVDDSRALARPAELKLVTRTGTLTRPAGGRAWVSFNAAPTILPLAEQDLPARLIVHWPDGTSDTIAIAETNSLYRVQHGPLLHADD